MIAARPYGFGAVPASCYNLSAAVCCLARDFTLSLRGLAAPGAVADPFV